MPKAATADRIYDTEERPMSEADRTKVGDELADVEQQIKAVEEEKRNVNTNYRVRIRKLKERADVLSRQWKDGVIEVSFEVVEVHDDERLIVDVERRDTGQRVTSRPMTEPEKEAARRRKQGKLFDGDDDEGEHDTEPPPAKKRAPRKPKK
jgi:hypothetical protein